MDRRLASQRCARELAAAVGYDFVHVHVELSTASRHPDMQREHIVMLACKDFVTSLSDEFELLIAVPLAGVIGGRSGFLQNGVGGDHLTWDQVVANTEMLERTLSLSAPELVGGHLNHAEAICFLPHVGLVHI